MESASICRRCKRKISERVLRDRKLHGAVDWMRLGYCSSKCLKRDVREGEITLGYRGGPSMFWMYFLPLSICTLLFIPLTLIVKALFYRGWSQLSNLTYYYIDHGMDPAKASAYDFTTFPGNSFYIIYILEILLFLLIFRRLHLRRPLSSLGPIESSINKALV